MKLAGKTIKEEAVATPEQVGEVLNEVAAELATKDKMPIHKEKVERKIYVGPPILGLAQYTVVEEKLPAHIEQYIKECKAIEELLVSIDKMAETEARTKTKGTLEYRQFEKVLAFKKGQGEI